MSNEQIAMSEEYMKYDHWYYWWRFSLLPKLRIRKADRHNEWGFSFDWLCFRIWTMMSPDIGAEIKLSDQDFQLRIYIPYLILMLSIPVFPIYFHQKTWRTGRPQRSTAKGEE